jgi:hypothetical protein
MRQFVRGPKLVEPLQSGPDQTTNNSTQISCLLLIGVCIRGCLVRRLAVQSRDDVYASRRDYQAVQERISQKVSFEGKIEILSFCPVAGDKAQSNYFAFGGYICPDKDVTVTLLLSCSGSRFSVDRQLGRGTWNRVGICIEPVVSGEVQISIQLGSVVPFSLWGLDAGPVILPQAIAEQNVGLDQLNSGQLAPETFFFPHDTAMNLEVDPDLSSRIHLSEGSPILVKKCSYCGRQLPLDLGRLGSLAFHKHNAKKTNHQNECRACKKWKINNSFNPLRTVDQLNESSLITRERKLLLRDPETLQEIKERTGAGLKSQVWKRFEKKCFYCGIALQLGEVQLDHTRPLAYLWPIDEHATCLCAEHNNLKKDKFPIDFYSREQLVRLSSISGLSLELLVKRELNEKELARIVANIEHFARQWEPRTFFAVNRKIVEIEPERDLFIELRKINPSLERQLKEQLNQRPPSVVSGGDEDLGTDMFELLIDSGTLTNGV